jgi:hypothetical protein
MNLFSHLAKSRLPYKARPEVEQLESRLALSGATAGIAAAGIVHSQEFIDNHLTVDYSHYLGRASDQAGYNAWSSAMQNGASSDEVETGFAGSAEYFARTGGTNQGFITQLYRDALGRDGSAAEISGWTSRMAAGETQAQVAKDFMGSTERRTNEIIGNYFHLLGRNGGQGEVDFWLNQMQQGATNDMVTIGFLSSPEFYQFSGGNIDSLFVNATFTDVLNRTPLGGPHAAGKDGGSVDEVAYWVNAMNP